MLQQANPPSRSRVRVSSSIFVLALVMGAPEAVAQDSSDPGPGPTESSAAAGGTLAAGASADADPSPAQDMAQLGDESVDMEAWKRRYRRYNTWEGSTGGIHLVDPISGAPGSVRIQLGLKGFAADDFMMDGDQIEQIGETLSMSWTAIELLEVYAAMAGRSTTSNLPDNGPANRDPRLENDFHVLGDAMLGVKMGAEVVPALSLGGDLAMVLPNSAGSVGIEPEGIGLRLRGNLSTDLRNLESRIPFIGRLGVSYQFDHSELLIEETEQQRYDALDAPSVRKQETQHLVSRVERFAMGINRVDFLSLGLGLEIPVEVAEELYLNPLLEWYWRFPFNRRNYGCPQVPRPDDVDTSESPYQAEALLYEGCLENEGVSAFPMVLAAGVRVVTPARGLSVLLGANIGLTGTSTFVRELAPIPPHEVLVAVGYDYDARPPEVKVVEKLVQPPLPPTGRVSGSVEQEGLEAPVAGATLRFSGTELSPLQTTEDGTFVSYELPPGQVAIEVSHPDFEPGSCSAVIPEQGGDVETSCVLSRLPQNGTFKGQVVDIWNMPVPGAVVKLTGPVALSVSCDENGNFEYELPPGDYAARVVAPGYLVRASDFAIAPRLPHELDFVLVGRPEESSVKVDVNEIRLTKRVQFMDGSSQIHSDSALVVAELADLLLRTPNIRRIKIWGPVMRSDKDEIMGLTRALATKQRLVNAGVAPERVQAAGGRDENFKITIEEQY